jgi:hypothetical protein
MVWQWCMAVVWPWWCAVVLAAAACSAARTWKARLISCPCSGAATALAGAAALGLRDGCNDRVQPFFLLKGMKRHCKCYLYQGCVMVASCHGSTHKACCSWGVSHPLGSCEPRTMLPCWTPCACVCRSVVCHIASLHIAAWTSLPRLHSDMHGQSTLERISAPIPSHPIPSHPTPPLGSCQACHCAVACGAGAGAAGVKVHSAVTQGTVQASPSMLGAACRMLMLMQGLCVGHGIKCY